MSSRLLRQCLATITIMIGGLCVTAGCGGTTAASVDDETVAMLAAGESAGFVFRIVATLVREPLDWTGTEAEVEQQALDRAPNILPLARCVEVSERDEHSVTLTLDRCGWLLDRELSGTVRLGVSAGFRSDHKRLRVEVEVAELVLPDLSAYQGHGTLLTTEAEPGRFDGSLHIRRTGAHGFDLESDGRFDASGTAQSPCVTVEGLGFVQTRSASVAVTWHQARYCSWGCGESGSLHGAGRFLQRVRFDRRSASRSVDDGPLLDLQQCRVGIRR